MRNLALAIAVLLTLPRWPAPALADPPVAAESPSSVDKWIADLESDTYAARVRATERLVMSGSHAIKPLEQAIEGGLGLETIDRGIDILRQLALTSRDTTTQDQAYAALQRISQRQLSSSSRRALTALHAFHEQRRQRARIQLIQLGAVFSTATVQVTLRLPSGFSSIRFGANWRGSPADFSQVAWVTGLRNEGTDDKWMIVIEGHFVGDDWISRIAKLENIRVLKFKSSQFGENAIEEFAKMPDLEILELLYCPVDDDDVEQMASLPKLSRVRLIGSRVSPAGVARLTQLAAQIDIDYRNGGFLGIRCSDNPCSISLVQENSSAAAAGFRVGDVITRYNGQPVQTMDKLTKLISHHTVGERVKVELLRADERIVREVELGAWD